MRKIIFTFLILLPFLSSYGQITLRDWAVENSYLQDGKIKYTSVAGETNFIASVQFQRANGQTAVNVQAIASFYSPETGRLDISDSIYVTTADFNQTVDWISKIKEFTAILAANKKRGTVSIKWRYLDTYTAPQNPKWSDYTFSSKVYETLNLNGVPNFSISGPSNICSTGNYSVANLPSGAAISWSISGAGNITGATNTNTVQVQSSGQGNISLTATVTKEDESKTANINITAGMPKAPTSISGPTTMYGSASYEFSTPLINGVTLYEWTVSGGLSFQQLGNVIIIRTPTLPSNYTPNTITIKVRSVNTCGQSTYFTKTVTLRGGQGGNT